MDNGDRETTLCNVGRNRDGSVFCNMKNDLSVTSDIVQMMRSALVITERLYEAYQLAEREKQDNENSYQWWPSEVKCKDCGRTIKLESEPETYLVDCGCGAMVIIEPPCGWELEAVRAIDLNKRKKKGVQNGEEKKRGEESEPTETI